MFIDVYVYIYFPQLSQRFFKKRIIKMPLMATNPVGFSHPRSQLCRCQVTSNDSTSASKCSHSSAGSVLRSLDLHVSHSSDSSDSSAHTQVYIYTSYIYISYMYISYTLRRFLGAHVTITNLLTRIRN